MVLAGLLLSAAAVAPPPVRIRVCTYGGEGVCSGGRLLLTRGRL